jgi:hypothetical protein
MCNNWVRHHCRKKAWNFYYSYHDEISGIFVQCVAYCPAVVYWLLTSLLRVRFVVDKVALEEVNLFICCFPPYSCCCQCGMLNNSPYYQPQSLVGASPLRTPRKKLNLHIMHLVIGEWWLTSYWLKQTASPHAERNLSSSNIYSVSMKYLYALQLIQKCKIDYIIIASCVVTSHPKSSSSHTHHILPDMLFMALVVVAHHSF